MSLSAVMSELKALGKEQTRKVWARHGMKDLYGVAFADLEKIRKRIKQDHALALALWDTGNCDARHLATMIVDPERMDAKTVDRWARDASYRMLCGMLGGIFRRNRFGKTRVEKWTASKKEWLGSIGWNLVAGLALHDDDLDDAYFENKLEVIEARIDEVPNFTKEGMNNALIAIGGRNSELREKAFAAADRIGKVEVDHGLTNCKTPLARPYIERMWARKGKNKGSARAQVRVAKTTRKKTTRKKAARKKTITETETKTGGRKKATAKAATKKTARKNTTAAKKTTRKKKTTATKKTARKKVAATKKMARKKATARTAPQKTGERRKTTRAATSRRKMNAARKTAASRRSLRRETTASERPGRRAR